MKKLMIIAIILILVLLAGTGILIKMSLDLVKPEPTLATTVPTEAPTVPTTEETEPPTTEPPPVYRNPLNGEILEEPYTGRLFASTISNIRDALPHVSVNEADMVMEMFVNGSVVRCLALFTEVEKVEAIGSVRSTRLMFNDIVKHYDAVLFHAGGSSQVLGNANSIGIDHFNLDHWDVSKLGVSYRDKVYRRAYEHCLFGIGPEMKAYAESQGVRVTQPESKDYYLRFSEDAAPVAGENAANITITITYNSYHKPTEMKYDSALGKYVWWQYDMEMKDQITEEPEAFTNVIVLYTEVGHDGIYQVTDFTAGGQGHFACGGKIVPILWECDGETEPFRFLDTNGEPLVMGVGNTYIAITQPGSRVIWE